MLLLFAIALVVWGLSLAKLRSDQHLLLVWALPLVFGFSVAAFAGSIYAQARNWIPGLAITAVGAGATWLLTSLLLFPESEVRQQAVGEHNSPTAKNQSSEDIVRQLQEDALETLRQANERLAAGVGTLSEVISFYQHFTKVKLDSCRTSEERIAVLTAAVELLQDLESDVSSRIEAGTMPEGLVPQVRQYRVETEIELARLKQEGSVQPMPSASVSQTYRPPESLLRQQREDAQATIQLASKRYSAGTGTLSELIAAHSQLTKVQLEACQTLQERITVMETSLKGAQDIEFTVNVAYNSGKVPEIDVLQARQYRVETGIELARLRSSNSAQTPWQEFRSFMRWDAFPKDYKALLDVCAVNVAAALLLYFLFVIGLYAVAPAQFVRWHEWIATAGVPVSEKIAKTLAPFLLDTPHTLNAVVLRYRERALKLFEDTQEVKDRVKWVPAPLVIDDEALYQYKRPPTLTSAKAYVAGLLEFQTRLGARSHQFGKQRSILSIEGPGGVGKSALAFQLARWASDSREDYKLARFPILPVLLRSLGSDPNKLSSVDEAAADSLRLIMDTSKISAPLLEALLRRKRILVLVDGVSELPHGAVDVSIRPDKGASNTRFLVVTSRLPTNLPEAHVIRPQGLTIELLDRVLDDLISVNVGSQRFNETDRETLRTRLRFLIKDAGESPTERQLPMIFIKLMIGRADRLLNEGKRLDQLPTGLAELVTEYTEHLLRNEGDLTGVVRQARIAAQVCMGKERIPAGRSENAYIAKGLSREILKTYLTAGLMSQSGDKSDPLFKFALDPIAEQLDANRIVIAIRDASTDQTEIDELTQQWERVPEDFIGALRRAAAGYIDTIRTTQPALFSRLWPGEVNATDSVATKPIDQGMRADSNPEVNVAQNQFPPLPRFFVGKVLSSLSEALASSVTEQKPLFAVIYDSKHRSQSKLNYSLGYFLEYETTKNLIRDNFVQALLDVQSPGVKEYVPIDDPLENCLLLVLRPDRTIVRREGVYANPGEGLSRTRSILQSVGRPSIRKTNSDQGLKTSASPTEPSEPTPAGIGTDPFKLAAASSAAVALPAEWKTLLDLSAQDRRTAMKKSWELLAKDILWAGNIEIGRLDPDSQAISRSLRKIHSSSTYGSELSLELTSLQMTARTLFNQSQFAYDPSESQAREFILRCESASQQLRGLPPSPIQGASNRMAWSKDGTIARSVKRHGYYKIKKQYVPEPGIEEDRYLGWYQPGGDAFDPSGAFTAISGPIHGHETLQGSTTCV